MTLGVIDESRRRAAKVVGFVYLFAMATSIFGEVVRGRLIVANDAGETARNIVAHEALFRLGIASELVTFVGTVLLLASLYVILRPVQPYLALMAASFRLVETSICVVMMLSSLDVLRVLSGAEYLRAFEADRLHVLARLSIGAHGAGYNVAFVFLGLGSTVFAWLWLRSDYIPRALALLGVVASLMLAAGSFSFILVPGLVANLSPWYMLPMGVFEVTMGFWLLLKGLRPSGLLEPDPAIGRAAAGVA